MVRHLLVVCAIAFSLAGACLGEVVAPVSIETPYNHITIERNGSVVEMRSVWRSTVYRESAVDLSDPARLMVPYTGFIAAGAAFHPKPKTALMIGLGGGGFNQFFEKAFSSAVMETVELDPQVLVVARQYLGFRTSERNKVTILDGRMFLRRSRVAYDWIILDAFRGGFVPPHLKTAEFYKLAQLHLAQNGVFMANVHTNSALFASDLRTMRAVFPQVGYFDVPPDNAVLVGANFTSPSFETMLKEAGRLSFNDVFKRNVDFAAASKFFDPVSAEASNKGTILTDDFSPTEFLDAVKTNNSRR
jgi:spermidine synthase